MTPTAPDLSAARCLDGERGQEQSLIALYFDLFAFRWISARYDAALEALNQAETLAHRHNLLIQEAKAIDERGLALQKLSRAKEAIVLHTRAARLAGKHALFTQLRISLNNLGQAYRRIGRHRQAIAHLQESEDLARAAGDYEDALGATVNRGIVLDESGDQRTAASVLRKCSAEAARRQAWREYAMAQTALGNLAWHQGRLNQAEQHYRTGLSAAKKHGIKDSEVELAVNLASVLEKLGDPKLALRILKVYEDDFGNTMEAHVCHNVLAGLYSENGDFDDARRNWEKGKSCAQVIGNDDCIALCSANLGYLYERGSQFDEAEREFETALAHEPDPEWKARLWADILRVALAHRNAPKAEEAFTEARRLASKHNLADVLINIHITVADYYWNGDLKAKQNAFKAYAVATVTALSELGGDGFPGVVGHIVIILSNPHNAPTEEEFSSLIDGLKKDLPALSDKTNKGAPAVLWPFKTAQRLLPFAGDRKRYAAELEKITENGRPSST